MKDNQQKPDSYETSAALIERRFRTDKIAEIETVVKHHTGKRLSQEQFDIYIEMSPAQLEIELALVQEKFKKEELQKQPSK